MLAQLSNPWWVFVLLGVCAGVLSGTLGLGAGIILVPVLALFLDFGQKSAQGMALAVMAPMALVGALQYWKNPQIDMNWTVVAFIVCGAVPATLLLGTELAARLPSDVLRRAFAVVLMVVAVKMFWTSSKPKQPALDGNLTNQNTVNSTENGDVNNDATTQ